MLAAILPATQAEHDERAQDRAEELGRQVTQNETAQHGLIVQLERLGSDTSPAAEAMRQRITDQFTKRYNQAKALQAELDGLTTAQPATQDLGLLDALPYRSRRVRRRPQPHQSQALRRIQRPGALPRPKKQATIWATITQATPGIVAALAVDPTLTTTTRMES